MSIFALEFDTFILANTARANAETTKGYAAVAKAIIFTCERVEEGIGQKEKITIFEVSNR